jgi:ribosomal protein L37AE/L43A
MYNRKIYKLYRFGKNMKNTEIKNNGTTDNAEITKELFCPICNNHIIRNRQGENKGFCLFCGYVGIGTDYKEQTDTPEQEKDKQDERARRTALLEQAHAQTQDGGLFVQSQEQLTKDAYKILKEIMNKRVTK